MNQRLHIVILAAGEGTRMQSALPKVLHRVGGKPMLLHLLETAAGLEPESIHVVIGSSAEQVREACGKPGVNWVIQQERRGTGHAVMQAMPNIPDGARVLVLSERTFTQAWTRRPAACAAAMRSSRVSRPTLARRSS